MNTLGGQAGGGEILQYGSNAAPSASNIDNSLIDAMSMIPAVRIAISFLLIFIAVYFIFKLGDIKTPFKGKGINHTLNRMEIIRRRDAKILRQNKILASITNLIERTPFRMSKYHEDYWQYNIERANIRVPGGARVLRAKELNALIKASIIMVCALSVFIVIFINAMGGVMLFIASILLGNTLPMMFIRSIVAAKDDEIREHFSDFYLMIHYVLMASSNTPLVGIMKSYAKTTTSDEMIRFVDVCVHYIDTYGEYSASRYIAKQYREIAEVGKLMRLIRQANDGGDVKAELIGFRQELLNAKRYEIEKRMNKMIKKAKASFNLLMPILIQAVISAMAIYISDLGLAKSLFGG